MADKAAVEARTGVNAMRFCATTILLLSIAGSDVGAQQPMQTVRGVVRGAGAPLAGAEVLIGPRQSVTGRDGSFEVDSLPSGSHHLTIRMVGYLPLRTEIVLGSTPAPERVYELVATPVLLPPVVVEGTRGGIYGTIRDTSQAPLAGVKVSALGIRGGEARTDSGGHFAFPRADRGAYLLRVRQDGFVERRFALDLTPGIGQEMAIALTPFPGRLSRVEDAGLQELGTRLSWGRARDRITAAGLKRYSSMPLCDLPRVVAELGRKKEVPVALSLNAVTIDKNATLGMVCAWRADEVELVEFGEDICQDVTGTLPALARIWCSGRTRNVPRSLSNSQPRISTQPAGMRYVIIWEKK